jgi:glycosyltransferase involved in cell wall biosynthesis
VLDRLLPGRAGVVGLLIGRGARAFAAARPAAVSARLVAADGLPAGAVSAHLQACDLMVQPYIDGISTRRTTAMAGLALGKALVTTDGPNTESVWRRSGAVELTPLDPRSLAASVLELLADPARRKALGARAERVYRERFALEHVVAELRALRLSAGR